MIRFSTFLSVVISSVRVCIANPAEVKQFENAEKALLADQRLVAVLKGASTEQPSLRQFSAAWKQAPNSVVDLAKETVLNYNLTFDRFLYVGDEVACELAMLEHPQSLDRLSSQIDATQKQIDDGKSGIPGSANSEIQALRSDIDFCRNINPDDKSYIEANHAEFQALLAETPR